MVQGSVDQGNADEENILKDLENSNKSREFPQVLKIYFATESLRLPGQVRPRTEGPPDWSNNENHDNVPCI